MVSFTDEQNSVLQYAEDGYDVLVDACIGSGKTTVIQECCSRLAKKNKKVLYLTYNRRLLEEARKRIDARDADVHTYHSFAGKMLNMANVYTNSEREVPYVFTHSMKKVYKYDTIVVDEYQDVSEDLKDMLWHLCKMSVNNYGFCPQFIVVGDKDQKIMDNTEINAVECIQELFAFLAFIHKQEFKQVQFTNCFRLSPDYASEIGQAWGKSIIGRNTNCTIDEMYVNDVVDFLAGFEPSEILVLGNNMSWGNRVAIQNQLEAQYPEKFNKDTVYSSITDRDTDRRNLDTSECAVFTTFDSAKGMERRVCVVCNFDNGYLESRMKHQTQRAVLKNLFLVAASRGKEYNIFCDNGKVRLLDFTRIGKIDGKPDVDMRVEYVSDMFDFKLKENVDACISDLDIEVIQKSGEVIDAVTNVGQIDLSACAGIHAQAVYFTNYNLDAEIDRAWNERISKGNFPKLTVPKDHWPLWKKILYLTALETGQERYFKQVKDEYISAESEKLLCERLAERFDRNEFVEKSCIAQFEECVDTDLDKVVGTKAIAGRMDVVKDGIPWELKFVSDLKAEHQLQAAFYAVAMGLDYSYLWNLKTNEIQKVCIKNVQTFMEDVLLCISKNQLTASRVGCTNFSQPCAEYTELFEFLN